MVVLHAVARSRRLTYRLRERAWLAAWMCGMVGLGVGAYLTPSSPDRKLFAVAAVGLLVIWIGIVTQYRRGVPVHVIMSKNPVAVDVPLAVPVSSGDHRDLPVGDRWLAWRAARNVDPVQKSPIR